MRRSYGSFLWLCSIFKGLLLVSLFLLSPMVHAKEMGSGDVEKVQPAPAEGETADAGIDDEDDVSVEPELKIADSSSVCWKEAYGRGVGTVPSTCGDDQVKSGLLCYPKPEPGYSVVAGVYSQDCPLGFKDNGLFCAKPDSYTRGAGYAWKLGDKAFSLDGARDRCTVDNSQGCDTEGAVVYPKCKANFHAVGCCTCSPDCPVGMTDIGVSCAKKTYVKAPITPKCAPGESYDAGLCYKPCADNSKGVGPVCWNECPSNMVNCGAMCGSSKEKCAEAIGKQIIALGKSAYKIYKFVDNNKNDTSEEGLTSQEVEGVKTLAEIVTQEIKNNGLSVDSAVSALVSGSSSKLSKKTITNLKALSKTFGDDKKKLIDVLKNPRGYDYLSNLKNVKAFGVGEVVESFDKPICGKHFSDR